MLARMERDGLVRRAPDPADGRSSRITLTEVAEARLPDAIATLLRGNQEVLNGFTDEETGQLVALLTRLIANLDRVASVEASPTRLERFLQNHKAQIVTQRPSETIVAVGKRLGDTGFRVTPAEIPRDQRLAHIDHRHAHPFRAALADPGFSGGEHGATAAAILLFGIDRQ